VADDGSTSAVTGAASSDERCRRRRVVADGETTPRTIGVPVELDVYDAAIVPRRPSRGARVVVPVAVVLLLAFAWWEGARSRDSAAAHDSVAAVIVAVVVAAIVLGRGRQRVRSAAWLVGARPALPRSPYEVGVAVWAVLIAAVLTWDLASVIVQAHALPTLSYWIGHLTRYDGGRAVVFALWVGLGVYLAAGWRTEAP
jgi:hypothetical protein